MAKLSGYIIDRRLNPKGKSLNNTQRFKRRLTGQIREAVQKSIADTPIKDADKERKIKVSAKGVREPRFRLDHLAGGERDFVLPGNKEFMPGDTLDKPKSGSSGAGKEAGQGEGEDDFVFLMPTEEILDIFFEDLELPNLERTTLKNAVAFKNRRAGISTAGSPTNINLIRTMRNSHGRRLALGRPSTADLAAVEAKITGLEESPHPLIKTAAEELITLREQRDRMIAKRKVVAFIDPIDVRYNSFTPQPLPTSQAVMFCLMDVSGSMGEREKDLAKRFYILLNLFLKRTYQKVDLVFIRHAVDAEEVNEHEFFHGVKSGGTVVASALEEMDRIRRERYPLDDWNIYAAQASDGYVNSGDGANSVRLLTNSILPIIQYYAYIEIHDEKDTLMNGVPASPPDLWRAYANLATRPSAKDLLAMAAVSQRPHIPQVFRHLFARTHANGSPAIK